MRNSLIHSWIHSLTCESYDALMSTQDTIVLLRQWRDVSQAVDRATEVVLAHHGLSETAAAVLMILADCQSPPTMRDLARLLGCDPSNVTLVATKLQEEAMIEKQPHPTDGRSRVLILTARGKAKKRQVLTELATANPLGVLPAAEQQQLLNLLRHVAR